MNKSHDPWEGGGGEAREVESEDDDYDGESVLYCDWGMMRDGPCQLHPLFGQYRLKSPRIFNTKRLGFLIVLGSRSNWVIGHLEEVVNHDNKHASQYRCSCGVTTCQNGVTSRD